MVAGLEHRSRPSGPLHAGRRGGFLKACVLSLSLGCQCPADLSSLPSQPPPTSVHTAASLRVLLVPVPSSSTKKSTHFLSLQGHGLSWQEETVVYLCLSFPSQMGVTKEKPRFHACVSLHWLHPTCFDLVICVDDCHISALRQLNLDVAFSLA